MNARIESLEQDIVVARADQALGQIAVQLPGATAVFRRLKLDFCCGGQISLRQATRDKNLDLNAVLIELGALERGSESVDSTEPGALVDHILERYHAVHRAQLPELIRMARRVEAVHRAHPDVPAGLTELLESMQDELLEHMQKEETILFPMLKAGGNPFVVHPIKVMRDEHVSHGRQLERLTALTHDATPPQDACNTWRALYAGVAQLGDDLINHIHLENNVLFAQFEPIPVAPAGCACAV